MGHQGSRSQKGETPRHFLGSGPQAPLPNTPFQDREPFTEEKTQGQGRAEQAIGTLLCSKNEREGPSPPPKSRVPPTGPVLSQSVSRLPGSHPPQAQPHPCSRKRAESHSNQALTQPPPRPTPPSTRPPRSGSWEPVPQPEPRPAKSALLLQGQPGVGKGSAPCSPPRQTQNSDAQQDTPRSSRGPAALGNSGSSAWQSWSHRGCKATAGRVPTGPGPLGVGTAAVRAPQFIQQVWGELQMGKQPAGDYGLVGPGPDPRGGRQAKLPKGPIPGDMGPKPPEPCDFSQDRNWIFL